MSDASPFKRKELKLERELTVCESIYDFMKSSATEAFKSVVNSEAITNMPPMYMFFFGTILIIILIAIFIELLVQGYQTSRKNIYLSPLSEFQYTPSSSSCSTIGLANTGSFLFTKGGSFAGGAGFVYSEASYVFEFTSFSTSQPEYVKMMNGLYDNLVLLGNLTSSKNLGYNLLIWFTYNVNPVGSYDQSSIQRFYLVGDPLTVFNTQSIIASISSVNGQCNVSSTAAFNPANGILSASFNYYDFINNDLCFDSANPSYLGYIAGSNADVFNLGFDIRTLVVAMSINLELLGLNSLILIPHLNGSIILNNVIYNTSSFYFAKFAGMSPIICITNTNLQKCLFPVGNTFAIPFFNHLGNSTSIPQPCLCSKLSQAEINDMYSLCNQFNLLTGLIFYNSPLPYDIVQLYLNYAVNSSFNELNNLAYNASYEASYFGQASPFSSEYSEPAARSELFEFCRLNNDTVCTILTFTSVDTAYAISNYYYQLVNGACSNQITPPYDGWQRLIEVPYAPLVQQYEQCQYTPSEVLVTQFGVQVGNLSVLTPFALFAVLAFIYVCKSVFGMNIPVTYSTSDKMQALDALGTSLLLARDKKLNGHHPEGPIDITLEHILKILERDADVVSNPYLLKDALDQIKLQRKQIEEDSTRFSPLQHGRTTARSAASYTVDINGVEMSAGASRPSFEQNVNILNKAAPKWVAKFYNLNDYSERNEVLTNLDELVEKFHELLQLRKTNESLASQRFWVIASRCGILKNIQMDSEVNGEKGSQGIAEVKEKICSLLLYHGSIVMNCEPQDLSASHSSSVGYVIGTEVYTLEQLREKGEVRVHIEK